MGIEYFYLCPAIQWKCAYVLEYWFQIFFKIDGIFLESLLKADLSHIHIDFQVAPSRQQANWSSHMFVYLDSLEMKSLCANLVVMRA